MAKRVFILFFMATVLVSCQFTETVVLQEDGSGTISLKMDMGEMMAFGMGMPDSLMTKMDTIVAMKDFLREKQDSISKLSDKQQNRLKKMEDFKIRATMDSDAGVLLFDMFTAFKNVTEANDFFNNFSETSQIVPNMGGDMKFNKDESSEEIMGVSYKFEKGKFKRDAFIIDKEKHQQQVDSLKGSEAFMGSMMYTLKYTFPRKIKKASIKDAKLSMDGKTIEVERSFIDYFKNPDVLDLEVEIEK
ncbi:hypothetical protein ATE92_1553 [Ulvibacter sp. MAR_2010_11]|uniref:hypothetical protein n=1 Tax=Ulvibacter sp. MAR_2010_11 TaxID=1250229 RepID=UPI000C2C42D8|nr:hypothetical protein [Ulvibacter sp. MAR_2010_11]PKA83401.1 hypothetical protein ATE92_1553 [Ulvibacter sp. MAR_2010_11]